MSETTHNLRCLPEFFDAVASGRKTFDVRKNDRGYQTGDILVLRKWSPEGANGPSYLTANGYATHDLDRAETVRVRVTYVLSGWGIEPGYVCMAIAREAA